MDVINNRPHKKAHRYIHHFMERRVFFVRNLDILHYTHAREMYEHFSVINYRVINLYKTDRKIVFIVIIIISLKKKKKKMLVVFALFRV